MVCDASVSYDLDCDGGMPTIATVLCNPRFCQLVRWKIIQRRHASDFVSFVYYRLNHAEGD